MTTRAPAVLIKHIRSKKTGSFDLNIKQKQIYISNILRHFPKEKRGALYKGHSDSIRLFTEWWADKYYIHISKTYCIHIHAHTHTHSTNTTYTSHK